MDNKELKDRWKAHYQLALVKKEKADYSGALDQLDYIPIRKVSKDFEDDILKLHYELKKQIASKFQN